MADFPPTQSDTRHAGLGPRPTSEAVPRFRDEGKHMRCYLLTEDPPCNSSPEKGFIAGLETFVKGQRSHLVTRLRREWLRVPFPVLQYEQR